MNLPGLVFVAAAFAMAAASAQTIHAITEPSTRTPVQDGKVGGALTDVVELSLKGAGLHDYRIDVYPWARAYQIAQRQPNTLIYPIARTPDREARFKWVGEIQKIHFHFVKLSARKDISIKKLDDARPYTIAVIRDDVRHVYLQNHGFTKLLPVAKWNDYVARLLKGQIDLLVLAESDLVRLCARDAATCKAFEESPAIDELTSSLFMAYSRDTPDDIVERTRQALEHAKAQGDVARLLDVKP